MLPLPLLGGSARPPSPTRGQAPPIKPPPPPRSASRAPITPITPLSRPHRH
uniref:Uncharacterized protein n=1 Tax=Arundo donax TaxID=35708 RepID=A0A0A8XVI8_ARUDO